jgi:hypothetical protein
MNDHSPNLQDSPVEGFGSASDFDKFQTSVTRRNRYIRTSEQEAFLSTIIASSNSRCEIIPCGELFWRAQRGNEWEEEEISDELVLVREAPFSSTRMKPLQDRATEGRVNPKGIPYLYLSTTEKAAISEVRPSLGEYVSVGEFQTQRDIKIVDCSRYRERLPPQLIDFDIPQEQWEECVWIGIDRAFSAPVNNTDDTAEYAATQILAETFRSSGIAGIKYKCAFDKDGYNIALFDVADADIVARHLRRVTGIDVSFRDECRSYYSTSAKPDQGP